MYLSDLFLHVSRLNPIKERNIMFWFIFGVLNLIWLGVTVYCRFVKKKPIRFEHILIKLILLKDLGRTRLFKTRDAFTIASFLLPLAIQYPMYRHTIAALNITLTVAMMLHSFNILLYIRKHKASIWVARASLLISLSLGIWTILEAKAEHYTQFMHLPK